MNDRSAPDTLRAFLRMCDRRDFSEWERVVADQIVVRFPFAPDGMPRKVEGSAPWESLVRAFMLDSLERFSWRDVDLHTTDDPELVMGTARSEALTKSGRPYTNQYCLLARARNGRLVEYSEYFDPAPVIAAFGELLGR
jgi:uncharacterized protein